MLYSTLCYHTLWQKKFNHAGIDLFNEPFSFSPMAMNRQGKTIFAFLVHSTITFPRAAPVTSQSVVSGTHAH